MLTVFLELLLPASGGSCLGGELFYNSLMVSSVTGGICSWPSQNISVIKESLYVSCPPYVENAQLCDGEVSSKGHARVS